MAATSDLGFWQGVEAELKQLENAADGEYLRRLIELAVRPDMPAGLLLLLADEEQRRGEFSKALERLNRASEGELNGDVEWRRIELGTRIERWAVVREAAGRLGMPVLPGDSPIQEEWGLIRVHYPEKTELGEGYIAMRTGPMTAKVLELTGPSGQVEHGDDEVLFNPSPLSQAEAGFDAVEIPAANALDANQEEASFIHTHDHEHGHDGACEHEFLNFSVMEILRPGNLQSFSLDGFHPGEAGIDELAELFEKFGGGLEYRSPDDYRIELPEGFEAPGGFYDSALSRAAEQGSQPGFYALFAVAHDVNLQAVHQSLRQFIEQRESFMIWPELCDAVGDRELLSQQIELAEALSL